MQELLSVEAVGVLVGMSARLVYYALDRGYLKCIRVGGVRVIPAQEVEAWRERRRARAVTKKGRTDRRYRMVDPWVQPQLVTPP